MIGMIRYDMNSGNLNILLHYIVSMFANADHNSPAAGDPQFD